MAIQIYRLPSNPKRLVQFRAPTVDDCLANCDLNDDLDELSTTSYLNQVQEGEVDDCTNWTAQDRRAALWWIFVTTSEQTCIAYEYTCELCDTKHTAVIDLRELDKESLTLTGASYIDDTLLFSEEEREIRLHPFTGFAMMDMEQQGLRLSLSESGSPERKRLLAELKILQVAHSFTFKDDIGKPNDEALELKLKAIKACLFVTE